MKSILLGPVRWYIERANDSGLEFGLNLEEVLELVGRAEEEGGGLPVAGDELPHRADLGRVQLVVQQRRLLQPPAHSAAAGPVVQLDRRGPWKIPLSGTELFYTRVETGE